MQVIQLSEKFVPSTGDAWVRVYVFTPQETFVVIGMYCECKNYINKNFKKSVYRVEFKNSIHWDSPNGSEISISKNNNLYKITVKDKVYWYKSMPNGWLNIYNIKDI